MPRCFPQLAPIDRVAVDTEADSLHCYFEKLCLVQLSFGGNDYLVDPLAGFDLAPLAECCTTRKSSCRAPTSICAFCAGASISSRREIFDTVIAARLLGIREFSLAALVERFFGVS